jgi:hypothetical protein
LYTNQAANAGQEILDSAQADTEYARKGGGQLDEGEDRAFEDMAAALRCAEEELMQLRVQAEENSQLKLECARLEQVLAYHPAPFFHFLLIVACSSRQQQL